MRRWIVSHFPAHRIFTDSFCGSASILFAKPPCYSEVINDLDGEIVNFHQILRDPDRSEDLTRRLRLTPYARAEFALAYEPSDDPLERARRLVIRSFMGFGSAAHNARHATGFRANANRSGTTPAHDWKGYPDVIASFTKRLKGVVIEQRPATQIIRQHDRTDALHYVDPPYVHATRAARQIANYRFEMSDADHTELSNVLHDCKGYVLISGYECSLYAALYADWPCLRHVSFADGARCRMECLWLSPSTATALSQGRLMF